MKKIKKIDTHVHAIPCRGIPKVSGAFYPTPTELRKMYDAIGVEKGVLLPPGTSPEFTTERVSPREAARMTVDYPETLGWWFCGIDPRFGSNSPSTDFSHYINYYKSQGARGVSEQIANIPLDDPRMMNLLSHCEACDMPIVFHFGTLGNDYGIVDEPGLPKLEKVLRAFPKLKIIGHSVRFWSELDEGVTYETAGLYPEGRIKGEGRAVKLMREYGNLFCDLSSLSGYNAMTRDTDFTYRFFEEFSDRILFATDIHDPNNITHRMLGLSAFIDESAEKGCITEENYRKICRENALLLLKEKENCNA